MTRLKTTKKPLPNDIHWQKSSIHKIQHTSWQCSECPPKATKMIWPPHVQWQVRKITTNLFQTILKQILSKKSSQIDQCSGKVVHCLSSNWRMTTTYKSVSKWYSQTKWIHTALGSQWRLTVWMAAVVSLTAQWVVPTSCHCKRQGLQPGNKDLLTANMKQCPPIQLS